MFALGIIIGGIIVALEYMFTDIYDDRKNTKKRVRTILEKGDVTFNKRTGEYSVEWKGNTVWNDGKWIYFESPWKYEAIFKGTSKFGLEIKSTVMERINRNMAV